MKKVDQVSYWQALINEWLEGNSSQREFCERKQIDFTCFKNWRYRLNNKRSSEKPTPSFISLTISDKLESINKEDIFEHSSIEIYLIDGKKIILRERLAETVVKHLLTTMHV